MSKRIPAQDRELFFVDLETTGLDPWKDEIVELAYAKERGPIKTVYFGVTEVPEFIDNLIGFTKRGLADKPFNSDDIFEFLEVTEGHTMVAANPSFDKSFLEAEKWFTFGYRMLDIESYATGRLGLTYVPSMADIYNLLNEREYFLPKPDHTAAGDVNCMRHAYHILKWMR